MDRCAKRDRRRKSGESAACTYAAAEIDMQMLLVRPKEKRRPSVRYSELPARKSVMIRDITERRAYFYAF